MKTITLKKLGVKGFKSFIAATEVDLSAEAGMTLIAGDNQVDARLGANGSGKSTLFGGDALCFCLFGTSVNGTRIGDLVSHGGKKTEAWCLLDIDGEEFTIDRAGPPARIYINNELSEQADIDRLVVLTQKQFLNSVIYGQEMPLLIDLSIPERGNMLDDVMGESLQIYMRAVEKARRRCIPITEDLNKLRVEIGRSEGSLEALPDIAALKVQSREWRAVIKKRIADLVAELATIVLNLEVGERELELLASYTDPDVVHRRLREREEARSVLKSEQAVCQSNLDRVEEDLAFFRDTARCPSCEQDIPEELAQSHIAKHEVEQRDIEKRLSEITAEVSKLDRRTAKLRAEWDEQRKLKSEVDRSRARLVAETQGHRSALAAGRKRLEAMRAETDPYRQQIERSASLRDELRGKLSGQRDRETNLKNQLVALEGWQQGFRRMRLFCINRVLRQLDIETMNAAQSLGLVGWQISHTTETETKSGTTKLGVQIKVQSPTRQGQFSSWSGGERQRVRLCTALGFGGMLQRMRAVRWRLEVFDEPTAWLSEDGIEDLLELLRTRSVQHDKVMYLCDHRGLQHAGFSRILTVCKGPEGSYVQ